MSTPETEAYIEQHAATLTEAEKRYIRAFGAPAFTPGPARNPYTAGLRIADAPTSDEAERMQRGGNHI